MKNSHTPTDTESERSQAFLGAALGPEDIGRLHNQPPEPIEPEPDEKTAAAKAEAEQSKEDKRVAALVANANDWAKVQPNTWTEEIAGEAVNWLNQLNKDWDKIEAKRVAERKPLRDQLQAIQDKYLPWLTRIGICRGAIEKPLDAYKLAADRQRRVREAEAARVAAEERRRADQLAEQAKAGGPNVVTNMIAAKEAEESAERARKAAAEVPKRTQIRGSLGGRTHTLRKVWRAELVEQDEFYLHVRNHTKVKELLMSLANEMARSLGAEATRLRLPKPRLRGCEIYSEES